MLRLRIKRGGDVYLGDSIRIVVNHIDQKNNIVELDFHAPKEVKILKGYLYRNNLRNQEAKTPQNQHDGAN